MAPKFAGFGNPARAAWDDYFSACYDIKMDRERRYDEMIQKQLARIDAETVSLRDILPDRHAALKAA